jgi:hypothetical protein
MVGMNKNVGKISKREGRKLAGEMKFRINDINKKKSESKRKMEIGQC